MALKQAQSPIEAANFTKLNDHIYLHKPTSLPTATSTDPGLVVVCPWAFAAPKHIVKYLTWYQQVYPTSELLVLQNSIHNMVWRPDTWQQSFFEPAIFAIKDYLSGLNDKKPRILLHVFSNGGCHSAMQLADCYERSNVGNIRPRQLPIHAIIFDSCPGLPDVDRGNRALTQGLPKGILAKVIGLPIIWAVLASSAVNHQLGLSEHAFHKIWRVYNDPNGIFLKESIPRTYIFSDTDDLVPETDSKRHAQEAIKALEGVGSTKAAATIRCEEFIGTTHVNHMAKNTNRYWSVVKDTWNRAEI